MPAPRGKAPSLIQHLNAQAPPKPVNAFLGIQKYYASADLLLRQASQYRSKRNDEQLYVMLMRFASLLIETIPSHKDFAKGDPKYAQLKKVLTDKIFPELDSVKLSLKTRDAPEPVARSLNRPSDVVRLTTSNLPQMDWMTGRPRPEMDVESLLDMMPPSQSRNSSAVVVPSMRQKPDSLAVSTLPAYQPKYTLSTLGQNNHALFYSSGAPALSVRNNAITPSASTGPRYPSLDNLTSTSAVQLPPPPPPFPADLASLTDAQRMMAQMQVSPSAGPPLAPQPYEVLSMSADHHMGVPGSCSDPHPAAPGPAPPEIPVSSTGPKELAKRAQLRDVHVSVALIEEFLRFAAANTARGIETCGILAAQLSANDSVFTISTLIIPKQKGTTDTVEMMSEEDVLMVHLDRELYPLGWIHTHPTQTCFLSSVDVHTQCSYQTMLDEAVAIVMAPADRSKKCGIFRLTTPGGLSLVQKCERRGFHMHPETSTGQEMYELCGHVFLNDRVKHEVVDLR